jgi:hypothetical protein
MTTLFFLAAYLMVGVVFWPYMLLYSITVAYAAPEVSLSFLFYWWDRCAARDGALQRSVSTWSCAARSAQATVEIKRELCHVQCALL